MDLGDTLYTIVSPIVSHYGVLWRRRARDRAGPYLLELSFRIFVSLPNVSIFFSPRGFGVEIIKSPLHLSSIPPVPIHLSPFLILSFGLIFPTALFGRLFLLSL